MMNQTTHWDATVDSKKYSFAYKREENKHIVTVNSVPIEIKRHFLSYLLGFDEKFSHDGIEGRLLIKRRLSGNAQTPGVVIEPDIAFNGILLQNGNKYVKRNNLVIILALMCLFIPLVILGGPYFLIGYIFMFFAIIPFRPSSFDVTNFITLFAFICTIIGLLLFFLY